MFSHEIAQDSSEFLPRWLRIPAACAYTGLPRSSFYRLMHLGVIRTIALCNPGKDRGTRLVDRLELDAFLSSLSAKQTVQKPATLSPVKVPARKRPAKPRLSKTVVKEVQ